MSVLNLAILGPFECSLDGQRQIKFRTSRAQALLVYLATEFALGSSHQGRESIMELLWPGMPPDSARTNLRQNLYYLRQAVSSAPLPGGGKAVAFLMSERQSIAVNPDFPLEFDVQRFTSLLAGPQKKWPQAVALYRGDFLTDFYLPDTNPFEEWAAARREAFRRQVLSALEGLTRTYVLQGRLNDAEGHARRQLAMDPLRETAYRQLMEVLYWSGRRAEALQLYQECVRILEDELDTSPSQATSTLADAIREGTLAGRPEIGELDIGSGLELDFGKQKAASTHEQDFASFSPEEQVSTVRHNLPAYSTPIIGREAELAALDGYIADSSVRLITIVGPGGVGKTRLATAAANRVLSGRLFPDGLLFIDLAPFQEAGHMLQAVADALSFPIQGGDDRSRRQLLDYLHHKKVMLLFDNFEHMLDEVTLVADMLQACPEAKILVTSRERLHLRLEQVFPIGGLAFPDLGTAGNAEGYSAVRLFLQSATRNQPDFRIRDEADLTHLTRICRIVAGMPLALELAASWVDILTLDEIASELQQGLDILETHLRDLPERQRSVRASFDYTWRILDEVEQAVFAQLSIFRGGFTRAAAQEVTGASMRQLSNLVNKSLIRFDMGRGRYEIHELLRQYGAEKLAQQPELEALTYDRHSNYFLRLLAGYTDALKGKGKLKALSIIEADLKNVLIAWNHASAQQNIEAINQSLESLWRFYWDFGRLELSEFEQAVASLRNGGAIGARGVVLGRLLAPLGRSYGRRGNTAKAREVLEESLDLLLRLGKPEERLTSLLFLAEVQETIEESNRLYREGLTLAREIGDRWAIGHALLYLGWNTRLTGNYHKAEQQINEALEQFRQSGDTGGIVTTLATLGSLAVDQGHYEDAIALIRESRSISHGFNPMFRLMGLNVWAQALHALGEYEEAEELLRQGLTLFSELGREDRESWLYLLGEAAFYRRDYTRAAQLYQESLAIAVEHIRLDWIVKNHAALGRLDGVQGRVIEARRHFLTALQTAIPLGRPPLLLDCLAGTAELFAEESDLDYAALLAMLINEHPASRAKTRERGEILLARIVKDLSSDEMDAVRQHSDQGNLATVAAQLLLDLETPP